MRYLIIALLLCSCSANWHIDRAIKKDPSILQKDTIVHRDTIRTYSERVEMDSTFIVSKDTVTIVKDNMTIRHFYHNDSVWIYGECDSTLIEVPYEVEIPVEKVVIQDPLIPRWLIWVLILIVILWALNKFVLKK